MSINTQPTAVNSALDRLAGAATALACVALVGTAIVEAWQVFARYVLNDSPSWTEPLALLLMSTTMMLGAAVGVRGNRHFGFFILLESVPPGMQRVLRFMSSAIAAAIGLMFAGWGGQMLLDTWSYPMAGAPLPQGMVFAPMCIGGALIALFSLERIVSPPPAVAAGD